VVEDGHGALELIIYPGSFPLDTYYPGNAGDVPGLVTPTSDVVISESYLYDTIAAGEHLLIHEFSHSLQQASDDGDVAEQRHYPVDFDEEDLVDDATANDPELNAYILGRFGAVPSNLEVFPTIQVIFESDPAALQAASPEVYEVFVEYHGFDPLTGRHAG
jgi:Mlc titration factor MtfA (ptsG expression regulator)